MLTKNDTILFARGRNTCMADFQFSMIKEGKASKWKDMVQNIWKKIAENLDFVEKSKFIKGSSEAATHRSSGINLQENSREGVLL